MDFKDLYKTHLNSSAAEPIESPIILRNVQARNWISF
jgi:hypothetical protein